MLGERKEQYTQSRSIQLDMGDMLYEQLLQLHVGYAEEMRMFLTHQIVSQERRLCSMAIRTLHAIQAPRDISTPVL